MVSIQSLYQYNCMLNTIGVNLRSSQYKDLQDAVAHYNIMLAAKPSIDNKLVTLPPCKNNHKHQKIVQQQRTIKNRILLNNLIKIKQQDRSPPITVKRKSLKSQYKVKQKEKSIERENVELHHRISQSRPFIGSMEEWNQHYKNHLNDEKIMKKTMHSSTAFKDKVYVTFHNLARTDVKSRFRLKSEINRLSCDGPLKLEVHCQVKNKEKKLKKRKTRKSYHTQSQIQFQQYLTKGKETLQNHKQREHPL